MSLGVWTHTAPLEGSWTSIRRPSAWRTLEVGMVLSKMVGQRGCRGRRVKPSSQSQAAQPAPVPGVTPESRFGL